MVYILSIRHGEHNTVMRGTFENSVFVEEQTGEKFDLQWDEEKAGWVTKKWFDEQLFVSLQEEKDRDWGDFFTILGLIVFAVTLTIKFDFDFE